MFVYKVEVEIRETEDGAVLEHYTNDFETESVMDEGDFWDFIAEGADDTYPDAEWVRVKLISTTEV